VEVLGDPSVAAVADGGRVPAPVVRCAGPAAPLVEAVGSTASLSPGGPMADGTAPGGAHTGTCVVRAEADGSGCLRITVTARVDVEDQPAERSGATTSITTAIGRVQDFLDTFVRQGR
jgi:hypothetical protein